MTVTDILLVTVDALRADRVGFLGYERDTTPAVDTLFERVDATVYDAAHAHGPTTFSSFPSIHTGQHAYESTDYPALDGKTLAERFADAGYHTASVTANAWVSPTYDYDSGVDDVHALGRGPRSATGRWERLRHRIGDALGDGLAYRAVKSAYDVVRDAGGSPSTEARIHRIVTDHRARPDPTFTWAHYMTTHAPYVPDPDRAPVSDTELQQEHQRELVDRAREDPDAVSKDDRRLLSDLYDEAVSHVDRRIATLLEAVDLDETLVCLTGDHGEAFFEHGYFEHPPWLHQELLHVPLVLLGAGVEETRVEAPVGLESLYETLPALAGLNVDPTLPPWDDPPAAVCSAVAHADRYTPETIRADALRLAVRSGDWKLHLPPDDSPDLYDIANDRGERDDVAGEHPAVVDRLRDRAEQFSEGFVFDGTAEVPQELRDRLADLGYME